jgi:hypothetical protein
MARVARGFTKEDAVDLDPALSTRRPYERARATGVYSAAVCKDPNSRAGERRRTYTVTEYFFWVRLLAAHRLGGWVSGGWRLGGGGNRVIA